MHVTAEKLISYSDREPEYPIVIKGFLWKAPDEVLHRQFTITDKYSADEVAAAVNAGVMWLCVDIYDQDDIRRLKAEAKARGVEMYEHSLANGYAAEWRITQSNRPPCPKTDGYIHYICGVLHMSMHRQVMGDWIEHSQKQTQGMSECRITVGLGEGVTVRCENAE